ncbi:DUF3179 domain-containing protein [Fulvivirgaceae bacterium BMA10]|uniref:DUF3179 domain-containing protein n=1 Tax=Splendidivirga corallicola TaxID=3051826 RepID=A0ABT8KH74_9BACT|nr:DUF3179 domain-containing protein [Fulvivirgaceae bacterium BMA10]
MKTKFFYLISLILIMACRDEDKPGNRPIPSGPDNTKQIIEGWSVPLNFVVDGGVGKDGIPAIDQPKFISSDKAHYLHDNDLIIGLKFGNEIRAYPHKILDKHEIVNDIVNNQPLTVSLCPLTGTAVGLKRIVNGTETTFGVSGLLYNSNLILYDRATDNNWSQMRWQSVNGSLICDTLATFPLVETTWGTWKYLYPNSQVMSKETGFDRNYDALPFSAIVGENDPTRFPVSSSDDRLPNHRRVHGIIVDGEVKVYKLESFERENRVIEDIFLTKEIVLAGDADKNFIVSFERKLNDGTRLAFQAVDKDNGIVMSDNEGNLWNIFGEAIEGPRKGQVLETTKSFMGYWFAWASVYPDPEIHDLDPSDN